MSKTTDTFDYIKINNCGILHYDKVNSLLSRPPTDYN